MKLPKIFNFGKKKNKTSPKNILEAESNETYHKMELFELVSHFNTSLTDGLSSSVASQVLAKNGKNIIQQKGKNIFVKITKYFFSGFCPLIWAAAIVCTLSWEPLGQIGGDQPQIVNLGLGVMLIIVILCQALFTAFQDWSSGRVMNSIKVSSFLKYSNFTSFKNS